MPALLGAILAGGNSSRMGQNKAFISFQSKPLTQHIIDRLKPQLSEVVLNINGSSKQEFGLKVVPDVRKKSFGPLSGLYAILKYAADNNFQKVLTTPCDTPFIPMDFVSRLCEFHDELIVVAKSANRIHPIHALWDVSLLKSLEDVLDNNHYKLMTWVSRHNFKEVVWDETPDPFLNINTPDDLLVASKLFSN